MTMCYSAYQMRLYEKHLQEWYIKQNIDFQTFSWLKIETSYSPH